MENIEFQIRIDNKRKDDCLDIFLTIIKTPQEKRNLKITILNSEIKELLNAVDNKITNNLDYYTSKILHDLGVPSNIKGYKYLKEGISLLYNNPDIYSFTKSIYPVIGLKYNTSSKNVERAIRNAIDISWVRANWDLMEDIFGYSIDQDKAKPTSKEYITSIVEYLKHNKFN